MIAYNVSKLADVPAFNESKALVSYQKFNKEQKLNENSSAGILPNHCWAFD